MLVFLYYKYFIIILNNLKGDEKVKKKLLIYIIINSLIFCPVSDPTVPLEPILILKISETHS